MRRLPVIFLFILLIVLSNSCSDISGIAVDEWREKVENLKENCSNWVNINDQPLFLINGKFHQPNFINRLKTSYIDSISVIKCEQAIKKYGEAGKRGAIEIYADENIFTDLESIDK